MKNMTLKQIAKVCGGIYYGDDEVGGMEADGIAIDSRKIEKNWIFIATKGEKVNGHSFIPQVMEKDALGVIVEELPMDIKESRDNKIPYVLVKDSFQAIKDIAEFYRSVLDIKVIGITGSVGKTSTKEMIASVVSMKYNTLKTEGNFNNEVGVPLTIFRLRDEHEVSIVEMGISDFGEMHRLSKIAKPDLCVITNIGQCHLENLHDRDGVLKAKTEIFDFMSLNSPVILNADDDKLLSIENNRQNTVYFSRDNGTKSKFYADHIDVKGILGTDCEIHTPNGDFHAHIPIPGEHMVYNALAAAAIGLELMVPIKQIKQGIEQVKALPGRSNVIKTDHYIILDDCYNANPVSMKAAIALLSATKGRKCAILGSMFELGDDEVMLHRQVGEYVAGMNIDVLVTIGELGKEIYEGAVLATGNDSISENYHCFESIEEFWKNSGTILKKGDVILVKASHGMQLEKIVKGLSD